MNTLPELVLALTETGERTLREQREKEREAELAQAESKRNLQLEVYRAAISFLKKTFGESVEEFVVNHTDEIDAITEWSNDITLQVAFPGYATITIWMPFANQLDGSKYINTAVYIVPTLQMGIPPEDEIGFYVYEFVYPYWNTNHQREKYPNKDLAIALARSKEEWEKWEKAQPVWKETKIRLISEHVEVDVRSSNGPTATCTNQERAFLNALNALSMKIVSGYNE
jgi:hypothetical protein